MFVGITTELAFTNYWVQPNKGFFNIFQNKIKHNVQ